MDELLNNVKYPFFQFANIAFNIQSAVIPDLTEYNPVYNKSTTITKKVVFFPD